MNAMSPEMRHTLPPIVLSRPGPYRNGDIVTGTWTLRNFGDAESNGAKVRFDIDAGLTLLPDRTSIPGCTQELVPEAFYTPDIYRDMTPAGVPIKDLAPGAAITITFALEIGKRTTNENLSVQVTLSTEGDTFTSPPTYIPMRLMPRIVVPKPEILTIKGNNQHFGLRFTVENQGGIEESAVRIHVPIPTGVTVASPIVPDGARIVLDKAGNSVGINLPHVAPYDKTEFGLQFQTTDQVVGDIIQVTGISVESESCGIIYVDPIVARLERSISFSQSALVLEPGPYVDAGRMMDVELHVHNDGRSAANDVPVSITLPHALIYASGSLSINGAPDTRRDDPSSIMVSLVRAHTTTIIRLKAMVRAPAENESRHEVRATIDGMEVPAYEFAVRAMPHFPPEENYMWLEAPLSIEPQTEREIFVKIANTGTETSRHVRLRLDTPDLALTNATVTAEEETRDVTVIPIRGNTARASSAIDLGTLGPQEVRLIAIKLHAPETFMNDARFPFTCYLRHDGNNEMRIGELTFIGRSIPRISEEKSYVRSQRTENLRIGQTRNLSLYLKNEGSDSATDISVDLGLPPGIDIEHIFGAQLQSDNTILFPEIPAQASSEAAITLRINDISSGDGVIEIFPRVSGERISTIHLAPLSLTTTSQSFLDEVLVEARPVDHESTINVHLQFKNIGDGPAKNIIVHTKNLNGYAHNSTAYNGMLLRDIKGQSPLSFGLVLAPVPPGDIVDITFAVNPKFDEPYTPLFYVESDDQEPFECQGIAYRPALKHRFVQSYLETHEEPVALTGGVERRERSLDPIDVTDVEYVEIEETQPIPAIEDERESHEPVVEADAIVSVDTPTETDLTPEGPGSDENDDLVEIAQSPEESGSAAEPEDESTSSDDVDFTTLPEMISPPVEVPIEVAKSSPLRFTATKRLHGPYSVLTLDVARLGRIKTTNDTLLKRTDLGWYRHVFGMRLFVPDRLLGVEPEVEAAWEQIYEALAKDFSVPLMRLILPVFEPEIDWAKSFDRPELPRPLETIVRAMPDLIKANDSYLEPELGERDIIGKIRTDSFDFFDDSMKTSVHQLNAIIPDMIPDTSATWPAIGEALNDYRNQLAESFKSIAYMSDERRHERMLSAPHDEMDEAFEHLQLLIENEVS
jgi:hypothetical protein